MLFKSHVVQTEFKKIVDFYENLCIIRTVKRIHLPILDADTGKRLDRERKLFSNTISNTISTKQRLPQPRQPRFVLFAFFHGAQASVTFALSDVLV